ncbi:MAG: hypothetical protein IBJ19_12330, partial [Gemmatimonadaceae bacterium]|nr:hypothetical protein [Gemmatimonadaceae bacterium]
RRSPVAVALAGFPEARGAFAETPRLTPRSPGAGAGVVAMRAGQRVQLGVEVA